LACVVVTYGEDYILERSPIVTLTRINVQSNPVDVRICSRYHHA